LLGAAFFAFILWGAYDPAMNAWTEGEFEGEGALRVPVWPARFTIVLGVALAALNYLLLAVQNFQSARDGLPPQGASASHL
jgi:TRAP-type C4-dicarboxylate transport system permease small subunit